MPTYKVTTTGAVTPPTQKLSLRIPTDLLLQVDLDAERRREDAGVLVSRSAAIVALLREALEANSRSEDG